MSSWPMYTQARNSLAQIYTFLLQILLNYKEKELAQAQNMAVFFNKYQNKNLLS